MAKVQGPLFSVDASGKFADSLVFGSWRGIKTVRSYAIPSNPNTPDQMKVRDNFSRATQFWGRLTGKDQVAWRSSASGQEYSGYNNLVKRAQDIYNADGVWVLFNNADEENISSDGATVTITGNEDVSAMIRYGTAAGSYSNSMSMSKTDNEDGTYEFSAELTGLPPNATVYYMVEIEPEDGFAGRTGEYSFSTASA